MDSKLVWDFLKFWEHILKNNASKVKLWTGISFMKFWLNPDRSNVGSRGNSKQYECLESGGGITSNTPAQIPYSNLHFPTFLSRSIAIFSLWSVILHPETQIPFSQRKMGKSQSLFYSVGPSTLLPATKRQNETSWETSASREITLISMFCVW